MISTALQTHIQVRLTSSTSHARVTLSYPKTSAALEFVRSQIDRMMDLQIVHADKVVAVISQQSQIVDANGRQVPLSEVCCPLSQGRCNLHEDSAAYDSHDRPLAKSLESNSKVSAADHLQRIVNTLQVYCHHFFGSSSLIAGEGAEIRGSMDRAPLLPPYYVIINGSYYADPSTR